MFSHLSHQSSQCLERFKKNCGRAARGFLPLGEVLAKAHVRSDLCLSRNTAQRQKDRAPHHLTARLQYFLNRSKWPKSGGHAVTAQPNAPIGKRTMDNPAFPVGRRRRAEDWPALPVTFRALTGKM